MKRHSRKPFIFAIVAILLAFAGMVLLARTSAPTRALATDPSCQASASSTQLAHAEGACDFARGKIAGARRRILDFVADDGRTFAVPLREVTDADIYELQHDAGSQATLRIVLGTPMYLDTAQKTYSLASGLNVEHYLGVGLVAMALSYLAAWTAISIISKRRATL